MNGDSAATGDEVRGVSGVSGLRGRSPYLPIALLKRLLLGSVLSRVAKDMQQKQEQVTRAKPEKKRRKMVLLNFQCTAFGRLELLKHTYF